jgi:hypothetical protein
VFKSLSIIVSNNNNKKDRCIETSFDCFYILSIIFIESYIIYSAHIMHGWYYIEIGRILYRNHEFYNIKFYNAPNVTEKAYNITIESAKALVALYIQHLTLYYLYYNI